MSDITAEALAGYLETRLDPDGDVTVTDLEEHVEGWSRDTASFTARWEADGTAREHRFVVRAESDAQVDDEGFEANDVETEYRTMEAAGDAPVPVPTTYWFEPDRSILGGSFFVVDHCPGDAPVVWDRDQRERLNEA